MKTRLVFTKNSKLSLVKCWLQFYVSQKFLKGVIRLLWDIVDDVDVRILRIRLFSSCRAFAEFRSQKCSLFMLDYADFGGMWWKQQLQQTKGKMGEGSGSWFSEFFVTLASILKSQNVMLGTQYMHSTSQETRGPKRDVTIYG